MTVEPSPAHTPLTSPPGIESNGTVNSPASTPNETTPLPPEPFANELPPDFWGDDPILPDTPQNAPDRYADDAVTGFSPPEASRVQAKPLTGPLQNDPRFILLTELFPGRMTDWQSAETPATPEADDAEGAPETVDLEAGLDADETD